MAGGFVEAPGGPAGSLSDVPNKNFILMVAGFSAMGGLLFGYDTGINGGVQVSTDFVRDFCLTTYQDDCSCYGTGSDYTFSKAFTNTMVTPWEGTTEVDPQNKAMAQNGEGICTASSGDVQWGCSCNAAKASRVPTGWNDDKGWYISLLSFGAMGGALSAGQLAEILGRRKTISVASAVFVLGTLVCVMAGNSLCVRASRSPTRAPNRTQRSACVTVTRAAVQQHAPGRSRRHRRAHRLPVGGAPDVRLRDRAEASEPPTFRRAVQAVHRAKNLTSFCPNQIRGLLGTLFQLAIVVGVFLSSPAARRRPYCTTFPSTAMRVL